MPRDFSALVLAAGRSTRMGRDKALLTCDGVPLWQRQRDLLAQAGAAEILLSARPEQAWAARTAGFAAVVPDVVVLGGPIAGLVAGLERATHPRLAVLAVDLPAMTPEWFVGLCAGCAPGVGRVGRRGDFFEPLAAIYPREISGLARDAITRAEFSLQRLLAEAVERGLMGEYEITAAEVPWFANWNEGSSPAKT